MAPVDVASNLLGRVDKVAPATDSNGRSRGSLLMTWTREGVMSIVATRKTGPAAGSAAGKVLASKSASKNAKKAAASALSQVEKKK